MTQLRHITGSLAVIGAALMLMAAALLGARDAALAAGTQPELLIAPLGSSSWAKAADGAWEFEGLLPGAPVTGGVQLRLAPCTGGSSSGSSETGGAGNRQGGSGRGRSASKSSGGSTMSADTGSSASDTDRSSS